MKSPWLNGIENLSFPSLQNDIKTDVLIIGGGIAGILTAYFLHERKIPYVLVDKGEICGNVTQNTTAKITFQHGLIYDKLTKSIGFENAQMYLESNKQAFQKYVSMCQDIDCDFEFKDNYIYSLGDKKKLEDELSALQNIGYHATFRENLPLPIKTAGAVCFPKQAQFHPLKFLRAIAKNLNIYEHTFVREMIGTTAVTDKGKIRAEKVIVATHFPFINKHGSYFMKLYQDRSYVIALENASNIDGMYLDENEKGLSFKNYGDLLFIGGGSHRTGKEGGNWAELRSFADIYYPAAKEKYFWATQDCMSLDSMPYIGNYSKRTPKMFVATGFNKWGMTSSMVSAMILSDMITGKRNEFAELYSPSRSILHPQLFVNGLESTVNLLTPTTKRCPHLGCALKYNKAEHSWDCPCHGSRFDEKGMLLNNPANGNLKRK